MNEKRKSRRDGERMSEAIRLEKPQKRLGLKGLICFIVLMDMFIPLSTDMYLPALPTMGSHLQGASDAAVKLSITCFFIFYAAGMLIWGPLSDKYGRRKPLLCGYVLYCLASFLCMISQQIEMLIFSRILQGVGAASITAISMAMIKDCFSGKTREIVLALVQTFSGFGPILAPVIGGWLLLVTDWRGIFFVLFFFGLVGLALTWLYEESLAPEQRLQGSAFQSFQQIFVAMKNKTFLWIIMIYGVLNIPFFMYITMSSYIYINYFSCSEQAYSYYYAISAFLSMAGPFLYIRFFQGSNKSTLCYICLGVSFIGGIGVMTVGQLQPYFFCLMIFLFYLFTNILRPYFTNLTLEQERDVGTASSVMNLGYNVFSCFGMLISSLQFQNMITAIGFMIALTSAISIAAWWKLVHSGKPIRGFYD